MIIDNDGNGSLAMFDPARVYRYRLERPVDSAGRGTAVFVMLNPSTADAFRDDPTIRRCMGFARAWGMRRLIVVNIFALRSTDPRALKRHPDPIGPGNDTEICRAALQNDALVIAAWGVHGEYQGRGVDVAIMLREQGVPTQCLGTSKDRHPRHPLMLRRDAVIEPLDIGSIGGAW